MYKTFKEFLIEGKDAYLYHSVRYNLIGNVLMHNQLFPSTAHEINGKNYNGTSVTRDYGFALDWLPIENNIILVLDQRKLAKNYKIVPYDYFKKGKLNPMYEYEEFIIGGVKNLSKYLISINIAKESVLIEDDFDGYDYDMNRIYDGLRKYKKIINRYIPRLYKEYYYDNKKTVDLIGI